MTLPVERLFIAGQTVETDQKVDLYNPAKLSEKVGECYLGTVEHVNQAVEAAERAWPEWADTPAEQRAQYLLEMAQYIDDNTEELSRLLVLEHGKILREAVIDLKSAAAALRYYATLHTELKDKVVENEQGTMILTRQPVGVVSVIVPWNFPIILAVHMLAPSLVAGNTVVIKPPTYVPLTITRILNHIAKRLPAGVLNVIPGSGSTVGAAMVEHPRVRKVAFTGSTETGRDIMRKAAGTIKKISMELGGNDAAILLPDVTVNDHLIDETIAASYTACGQICYAMKRIYVYRDHYENFVKRFTEAADKIVVGFGLDPEVTMGAINNKPQYESVLKLIEEAKQTGATVKEVGRLSDKVSRDQGYFILPHIVTDVDNRHPIVQEEQFGPVIPILPYDTIDEAIKMANDTEYGLANSIWTADIEKGFKLARRLQSGSVFINTHKVGASAANMPFGGFKQSGIGRGHGVEALYEHTELQAIIRRIDM